MLLCGCATQKPPFRVTGVLEIGSDQPGGQCGGVSKGALSLGERRASVDFVTWAETLRLSPSVLRQTSTPCAFLYH